MGVRASRLGPEPISSERLGPPRAGRSPGGASGKFCLGQSCETRCGPTEIGRTEYTQRYVQTKRRLPETTRWSARMQDMKLEGFANIGVMVESPRIVQTWIEKARNGAFDDATNNAQELTQCYGDTFDYLAHKCPTDAAKLMAILNQLGGHLAGAKLSLRSRLTTWNRHLEQTVVAEVGIRKALAAEGFTKLAANLKTGGLGDQNTYEKVMASIDDLTMSVVNHSVE